MEGKLIVLEGIDGAGLTTQCFLLEKKLKEMGYKVVLTKEPTNGLIGGLIKAALKGEWKTSNRTLQLLFSADRSHHLDLEILPALKQGKIVISDRYYLSTIAYGMENVPKEWLVTINSIFRTPDVIFLLDLPVEVALKRIAESRFGFEFFEQKEKLERIRSNFLQLCKEYKNCFVIDADKKIEEIHETIMNILKKNGVI